MPLCSFQSNILCFYLDPAGGPADPWTPGLISSRNEIISLQHFQSQRFYALLIAIVRISTSNILVQIPVQKLLFNGHMILISRTNLHQRIFEINGNHRYFHCIKFSKNFDFYYNKQRPNITYVVISITILMTVSLIINNISVAL